jgi:1-phosphatidylinositol phosphodiesterase
LTAYIEDYYQPLTPTGSSAIENIKWKYNATVANIDKATIQHPDSLFWTWASGTNLENSPPDWPRIMAIGNGTEYTPNGGVNQHLLPYLREQKGKRVGIVMFDFFDQPSDLIDTFLDI